jgi:GNAT superfamily N-acetyltransferase
MTAEQPRPGSDIRLVDVGPGFDRAVLARFYMEVMEPSLPPAELMPLAALEQALAGQHGQTTKAVLALDASGRAVGGVIGEWYPASEVLLLAYLAAHPDLRGRGIGTRLLQEAVPRWYEEFKPHLSVGEVEDPRFFATTATEDPAARLRLYERLGGSLLDMSYFQPQITPGAGRVYGMLLLAFQIDPAIVTRTGTGSVIDGRVIAAFLEEYFIACEGPEVVDDPEYRRLRAQADRPGGLPLLAVSRFADVPPLDVPGGWPPE